MARTIPEQWPTENEHGDEVHPAFGNIQANRVSSSHGASLFDSEIRHQHYVVLRISSATRRRDLSRDWIHANSQPFIEVAMSETQWATMIASMNTGGTPCTIQWLGKKKYEPGHQPRIPFAPRMALSMDEVRRSSKRSIEKIKAAFETYKEKKTAVNLRKLEIAIEHLPSNATFAAESLTEHAENVVQKAKADIVAMVDSRARQLGIDPHVVAMELGDLESPAALEAPTYVAPGDRRERF